MTAELGMLLQTVENRLNGLSMQAQTSTDSGASTIASGSPTCPAGKTCSNGEKGGQDIIIVVVVAAVTGAVAGYIAGKVASSGEKGGQD
jgi:hypothetical protein